MLPDGTSGADDRWEQVLADLERAMRTPEQAWTPPDGLPPLPQRHRVRAERVLAALLRRRTDVTAEAGAVQTELRLLHTAGTATDSAVYLDLSC